MNQKNNPVLDSIYRTASHQGLQIENHSNGLKMFVDPHRGYGQIDVMQISPGIYLKLYDLKLRRQLEVDLSLNNFDTVSLSHVSTGTIQYRSKGQQSHYSEVSQFNTLFVNSDDSAEIVYRLPLGKHIQFCTILIEKSKIVEQNNIDDGLKRDLADSIKFLPQEGTMICRDDIEIRRLAQQMLNHSNSSPFHNIISRGSAINLLGLLLSNLLEEVDSNHVNDSGMELDQLETCLAITEYIKNSLKEKLVIGELAKRFEISARKMQVGVKHIYGHTMADHISNLRLDASRRMIQNSELSINDIRKACGFNSFSYFSKKFRMKFGYSPREYQDVFSKGKDIYEICYTSSSIENLDEGHIKSIMTNSIENNRIWNVTGCLLYHNHEFFQIIEGPRDNILDLFGKIKKDHRHFDIDILWQGSKRFRNFGLWNMTLIREDDDLRIIYDHKDDDQDLTHVIGQASDSRQIAQAIWGSLRERLIS